MTAAPSDHETLARLHEEIGRETERIAGLKGRIRVLDVEVAGWKMPPAPHPRALARAPAGGQVWPVLIAALVATALMGRLLAQVLMP